MAGVISEKSESRQFTLGQNAGRELVYVITGTDDETEVLSLLTGAAPASYLGVVLESVHAEPLGNGVWIGHATYVRLENNNEFTFETTGGTQKVTQSLNTTIYPGPTGEAPDFGGAIGVDGDKVEGVDITVPAYQFSETWYIADALVTQDYKLALFNTTGRVNNASFRGFASGEVLCLGVTGSKRGDTNWAITFRFACSPNATDLEVGGISGITKNGWDYLWVRYDDFEDDGGYALVKRPIAAYVEQVYQYSNFSALGIGT